MNFGIIGAANTAGPLLTMRADALIPGKHNIICELSKKTYIEGAIWTVPQCTLSQGTQTSPIPIYTKLLCLISKRKRTE